MLGGSGADVIAEDDADVARAISHWMTIHRPATVLMDQSLPTGVQQAFFQAATSAGVDRVLTYGFDAPGNVALHSDALLTKSGALASDLFAGQYESAFKIG